MLCVPVFDVEGKTIAVIQAINKEQNATEKVKGHIKGKEHILLTLAQSIIHLKL